MLDLLGDIGGLLDALVIICEIILLPFVSYQYKKNLASLLVSIIPSSKKEMRVDETEKRSSFIKSYGHNKEDQ